MLNKVILLGNLGKDPEFNNLEGGRMVAKFSLATTEVWRDKEGNKKEETQWHNCAAWGNSAKAINEYCQKGSRLYIEGKITYRNYEKDGEKKYFTEIVVNNFKFLSGKQENNPNNSQNTQENSSEQVNDDLPF